MEDLCRLPDNAIRNVVGNLEPCQLLPLSLYSRELYELIKSLFEGAFVWTFHMFREEIYVKYEGYIDQYDLINRRQMNELSPLLRDRSLIDAPVPDNNPILREVNVMKAWISYICHLFTFTTISHFVSDGSERGFREKFGSLFSWFDECELFVECCEINGSIDNDDLDMVLNNLEMTKRLVLAADIDEDYRFNGDIELASIEIHESDFVTLENALRMSCSHINLMWTEWTQHESNLFFRHFFENQNVTLQSLDIGVPQIQAEVLLDGIPFETRDENLVRYYRKFNRRVCEIRGGIDIRRRSDRVQATILLNQDFEGTFITLVVWQGENAQLRNENVEEINVGVQEMEIDD